MTGRDQRAERHAESVERVIPASPQEIFAVLTDIDQHAALDGSGMLQGSAEGPRPLALGSRFSMGMRQARLPYRSMSTVVEYEPDRLIAWSSVGEVAGRRVVGGQRWRYELTPEGAGTRVRHSYVWGYAAARRLTIELPGYPRRMREAMAHTLRRLEAHLTDG